MDTYDEIVDDLTFEEYDEIYGDSLRNMYGGCITGRWTSEESNIEEVERVHDSKVLLVDGDFAKLEALALSGLIKDETMRSSKRIAELMYKGVAMSTMSIKPISYMDPTGVLHGFFRSNQPPQPKSINAKQAWKKRGKTSKRKGTR